VALSQKELDALDKRVAESIDRFVDRARNRAYSEEVAKLINGAFDKDAKAAAAAKARLARKIAPDRAVREHLLSRMHAPGDNSAYVGIALMLFADSGPTKNQWHLSTLHCLIHTQPPISKVE
jgi:hypothetical protein